MQLCWRETHLSQPCVSFRPQMQRCLLLTHLVQSWRSLAGVPHKHLWFFAKHLLNAEPQMHLCVFATQRKLEPVPQKHRWVVAKQRL